jgi:hypothetical protein
MEASMSMAEARKQDARTITSGMIYDEAEGARLAAAEILEKLTGATKEGEVEDPLAELLTALQTLVQGQAVILRRLDAIERRLDGRLPGSAR